MYNMLKAKPEKSSAFILSGQSVSEPALNGDVSVLLPDLPLKGDSLSAVKYDQNPSKPRSFKVEEFCD